MGTVRNDWDESPRRRGLSPMTAVRRACLAVLAGALIAIQPTAPAQDLDAQIAESRRHQAERARRIQTLETELAASAQREMQLVGEVQALNLQLTNLRERDTELRADLARLGLAIRNLDGRITGLNRQVERGKDTVSALVRSLHRQASSRYLHLIVRAESLTDLLARSYFLSRIVDADVRLVRELQVDIAELAAAREERGRQAAALETARAEIQRTAALTDRQRAQQQSALNTLRQTLAGQQVLLVRTRQAQVQAERDLATLLRRQAEAQAALREQIARLRPGRFIAPIIGGRVIAGYGEAASLFQEIRAPQRGAAVRAVEAGYVIGINFNSNLGFTVEVQHSGNLVTLYANLARPALRLFQEVARGEVIGYLGGDSLIDPDVLWFGVAIERDGRVDFVDPQDYF